MRYRVPDASHSPRTSRPLASKYGANSHLHDDPPGSPRRYRDHRHRIAGPRTGSAPGRKGCGELAKKPAALYVSPLERARETAAPIAKALRLRPVIERGLLECDFGTWTGKKLSLLRRKAEWRAVQNAPSTFRFPEGESFTEMQLRIWTTLERLAKKHRNRVIVVVSHADPIKAAVTYAQGVPLDLFQRTVISTCSISAIAFTDANPVVLSVNNTGSLLELMPS
jgi:broad specificity phosphatase PhoE